VSNKFDNFIAYVSPERALRRMRTRPVLEIVQSHQRKYEGASKGKRMQGWKTSSSSGNAEVRPTLQTLRDRSRDLVRNNGWAKKGIGVISSNVIGDGIIPRAMPPLGSEKYADKKRAEIANQLWIQWGESVYCDFDRKMDIYGLQDLIMRTIAESGEVLVRRIFDKENPVLPLRLQVLEPDFIDTAKNENTEGGGQIINGIEYDKKGTRVAFWLFDQHPGDNYVFKPTGFKSNRVNANEIIHAFRVERSNQNRGVPWLAPVIVKFRNFDEYEDGQLMRQKIASMFAGYITKKDELSSNQTSSTVEDTVYPGTLQVLSDNETIQFSDPPTVDGYRDVLAVTLLGIAAGLEITFESLTGDLSNVNFSSGRMGWIEFFRNIKKWRQQIIKPQVLDVIWGWFIEDATIAVADLTGITANWTPPRREMIDPVKETEATKSEIRAGLKSLSEAIRERGFDPDDVLNERKDELVKLDTLGISTDSDPRQDKTKNDGGKNANAENAGS